MKRNEPSGAGARYEIALPTTRIARILAILLLAFVPVRCLVQCASYVTAHLEPLDGPPMEALHTRDGVLALLSGATFLCVSLPLLVALAVYFAIFFYRANRNLRASGVRGLEYTPGMAAGWFFVPIANLGMPYFVACELWRASEPLAAGERIEARGWSKARVPALLTAWWILTIAGEFSDRATGIADRLDAAWGSSAVYLVLQLALWTAAALYARRVVRALDERVTARVATAEFAPADAATPGERWN